MNASTRCGYSTGWRAPTRRELLSIVHNGKTASPVIDTDYFPNTAGSLYWSADTYAPGPANAWYVRFANGYTGANNKGNGSLVRLVRSGQ
jgi:hypothetical protein